MGGFREREATVPKSTNGFGTRYYGERAYQSDGSYLTTNFFCLMYLPIFPLHSVRVIPDPKNSEWSPNKTNYYMVLEKRTPDVMQTASIYLCGLIVLAVTVLYFVYILPGLPGMTSSWLAPIPLILMILPLFGIVLLLRKNARSRMRNESSLGMDPGMK